MVDQKLIGSDLKECPLCNNKVHEFGEDHPEYGCEGCKRIWIFSNDGMWVSKARKVKVIREPKAGDSIDDFLEEIRE